MAEYKFPWFKVLTIVVPIIVAAVTFGAVTFADSEKTKQKLDNTINAQKAHADKPGHQEMLKLMTEQRTRYNFIQEDLEEIKTILRQTRTTDYRGRD
jgi:Rieske Fe-S protein